MNGLEKIKQPNSLWKNRCLVGIGRDSTIAVITRISKERVKKIMFLELVFLALVAPVMAVADPIFSLICRSQKKWFW